MAILKDLIVQGPSRFIGDITGNKSTFTGDVTGNKFITNGGIASLFVKGDGTLDSTTYELPVPLEEVTGTVTSLTCEPNKYYRFSSKVNTLAVTLPTITDNTKKTIILYFTAGLTPDITFVTSSNVYYSNDFYIELGKTYEIYLTWNGLWTVVLEEVVALPSTYNRVKYIENINIDNVIWRTGIMVNLDLKLKLDFCMSDYNNGNNGDSCPTLLEYRTGYSATPVSIMHKLNNFIVQFGSTTYNIPFDTGRHSFVINNRKVYWDNTLIIEESNAEFSTGSNNGITLFCKTNRNLGVTNWGTACRARFYEITIDGHLLIPCVRKSDLVYGLYDTYNRYFFSDTTKLTGLSYKPDAVDLLPASLYSSRGKRGFLYLNSEDKTASMPLPTAGSTYYIPKLNYNSSGTITTAWENIDTILTTIVNHGTSDTTFELTENRYHKWGSVASLTLTLATPQNSAILNEYIFSFTSPATPTTLSVPASVNWVTPLDIEPNKLYRVSIIDNLATWITSDMVVPIGDVNTPEFATKAYVDAGLALKEDSSNKVTSVDENSTDTQYPSAKAMYDALNSE